MVTEISKNFCTRARKFDRLLQAAAKVKAKVIVLGDSKQIQPIEAGQIFGAMHRVFGGDELLTVIRQKGEEAQAFLRLRNATTQADVAGVVGYLEKHDRLHLAKDSRQAIATLINDWQQFHAGHPGKEALIVASLNESVDRLNGGVRELLKKDGTLVDGQLFTRKDGSTIELAAKDRIVFLENKKWQGIYRSDYATILSIKGSMVQALRSDKKLLSFDMARFDQVSHGYAVTAHRAQGATVDRALVYADGAFMDREKAYVALTRGRAGNRLYADEASLGLLSWEQQTEMRAMAAVERAAYQRGAYRERLIERIGRSGQKNTTFGFRLDSFKERSSGRLERALSQIKAFSEQLRGTPARNAAKDQGRER